MADGGKAICFCECKWYSDISSNVAYDRHRNQLARVIENALLLRNDEGAYAEVVHVTLVTPAVFRHPRPWSRLYQYKWDDYRDRGNLLADLEVCRLPPRPGLANPTDRIEALRLHWVTYEEIFEGAPESQLKEPGLEFFRRHRGETLRSI